MQSNTFSSIIQSTQQLGGSFSGIPHISPAEIVMDSLISYWILSLSHIHVQLSASFALQGISFNPPR